MKTVINRFKHLFLSVFLLGILFVLPVDQADSFAWRSAK